MNIDIVCVCRIHTAVYLALPLNALQLHTEKTQLFMVICLISPSFAVVVFEECFYWLEVCIILLGVGNY